MNRVDLQLLLVELWSWNASREAIDIENKIIVAFEAQALRIAELTTWTTVIEKPDPWKAVLLKMTNHYEPNLYAVGYWNGERWSTLDKPFAWRYIYP